jgi:G3E family GTPase
MTKITFSIGPLGSGKTQFVTEYIREHIAKDTGANQVNTSNRLAVAVSDLGALNDDGRRIKTAHPNADVFGFKAGCVCCERRQDLEKLLEQIDPSYDNIIIEPSGAANPADFISVVEEIKIKSRPDFTIDDVFLMIPAIHYDQVAQLYSVRAGLSVANHVVLTKTKHVSQDKLALIKKDIRKQNIVGSVSEYDVNTDTKLRLPSRMPWRKTDQVQLEHGHEHYHRITMPLAELSVTELENLLGIQKQGGIVLGTQNVNTSKIGINPIPRIKGVIPGYEFDVVFGELTVRPTSQTIGISRATIIFAKEQSQIALDLASKARSYLATDTKPLSADASLGEKQAAFKYYLDFAHTAQPTNLGRIVANYEATDVPYSIAKDIFLTTKDSAALELALIPYINIRLQALRELPKSTQDDKPYVGVMLGSYLLQMISTKDNIEWEKLCDSTQIEKIKQEVAPSYVAHLKSFTKHTHGSSLEPQDKHYPFFAAMAKLAKPYCNSNLFEDAKQNMITQLDNSFPVASDSWRNI